MLGDQPAHERPDNFMGIAKRDALGNQIVSNVGRDQQSRGRLLGHGGVDGESTDDSRSGAKRRSNRVFRLEQSFFVYLQVLAVADWQSLHRRQPSRQAADDAAGFSSNE